MSKPNIIVNYENNQTKIRSNTLGNSENNYNNKTKIIKNRTILTDNKGYYPVNDNKFSHQEDDSFNNFTFKNNNFFDMTFKEKNFEEEYSQINNKNYEHSPHVSFSIDNYHQNTNQYQRYEMPMKPNPIYNKNYYVNTNQGNVNIYNTTNLNNNIYLLNNQNHSTFNHPNKNIHIKPNTNNLNINKSNSINNNYSNYPQNSTIGTLNTVEDSNVTLDNLRYGNRNPLVKDGITRNNGYNVLNNINTSQQINYDTVAYDYVNNNNNQQDDYYKTGNPQVKKKDSKIKLNKQISKNDKINQTYYEMNYETSENQINENNVKKYKSNEKSKQKNFNQIYNNYSINTNLSNSNENSINNSMHSHQGVYKSESKQAKMIFDLKQDIIERDKSKNKLSKILLNRI